MKGMDWRGRGIERWKEGWIEREMDEGMNRGMDGEELDGELQS